jgi:hypothetical protein
VRSGRPAVLEKTIGCMMIAAPGAIAVLVFVGGIIAFFAST